MSSTLKPTPKTVSWNSPGFNVKLVPDDRLISIDLYPGSNNEPILLEYHEFDHIANIIDDLRGMVEVNTQED